MKTVCVLACCLMGLATMAATSPAAVAAEKFVPQGHTYSPDQDRLPLLNSYQDRINSQADIYESEIYRIQRERAIQDAEIQRHIQHDLSGGSTFQPRY